MNEKIKLLRKTMQEKDIQACIVPTTDPHISEYPPRHWKTRKWLSGFTGSAGTVVVTANKAGLWTDSRYFLQAEEQLKGSGIVLFKAGLPDTPTYTQWLTEQLEVGDTVGIEGEVFESAEASDLINVFNEAGIKTRTDFAPWNKLWGDRPPIPGDKVFLLPKKLTGLSTKEKVEQALKEIDCLGGDATVLGSLDQVAWLFNLRGTDIQYNPVAVAYGIVSKKETVLFIDSRKLTAETIGELRREDVVLADYNKIYDYISACPKGYRFVVAPNKMNYRLYSHIEKMGLIIDQGVHPIDRLKGQKNETEVKNIRNAMKKDGVALVRFLIWIEEAMASGEVVSELDVAEKLRQYRSEQSQYFSESFSTIAGYNAHGAIVHYEANEASSAQLRPEGILLVDSGAQYFDGTTDITRTIALGEVSEEVKKDFTNVLKGNIRLSMAKFPKGTVGMQLDVLARQFIWKEGQNYLHGTGHGVGCFLNVHEGPQSIRMNHNPTPLLPGMITSNEPGLYKAGRYGIRIENLLLTVKDKETEFGEYYAFEVLTLCPIDTRLIDYSLMTQEETDWLNSYHEKVYEALSPLLREVEKEWLRGKLKVKD